MNQAGFEFTDQPIDPVTEPVRAPWAPGPATSKAGADAVQDKLTRQCAELLAVYETRGPLTDHEAALALSWERTTVIPRRHQLARLGKIQHRGTRRNADTGIQNDVWGIT